MVLKLALALAVLSLMVRSRGFLLPQRKHMVNTCMHEMLKSEGEEGVNLTFDKLIDALRGEERKAASFRQVAST